MDFDHLRITIRGRAELLPEAASLLDAQGRPLPALGGLSLSIEEPLRVAVRDPSAVLGHAATTSGGDFSVPDVPVREVHQSLAAHLSHESLVPSSTVVFDVALTGTRPRTHLIDTRVWALPLGFHEALTRAIGEERIRAHTEERAHTLREAGFVLGRVVDASGTPLAGARVEPERSELAQRIYYPAPDLQSASQEGTSASGLFVYVHSGLDAETFRLTLRDAPEYIPRHASIAPGLGLVLTLSPGSFPP